MVATVEVGGAPLALLEMSEGSCPLLFVISRRVGARSEDKTKGWDEEVSYLDYLLEIRVAPVRCCQK